MRSSLARAASVRFFYRRRLLKSVRLLALGYLGVLVLMMFFEEKLIYFPTKYPTGNWEPPWGSEDVWFTADDGTRLHGWYFNQPNAEYHLIYFHGNADYVANLGALADEYRTALNASVLVFDYRGYGRSEGRPSEAGIIQDAFAAEHWLREREQVTSKQIVLVGRSLGGAVAIAAARRNPPGALVLQSTFSSLPDVAARHYPWLPVRWLMRNRFDSLEAIQECACPVIQSHGTADTVVPFDLAEKLFRQTPQPKQFYRVEGGGHNQAEGSEYVDRLREFLHQHCPPS